MVPALILKRLEEKLKAIKPDSRLQHYVNLFAGTSTGGIIAAGLCMGRSKKQAQNFRSGNLAAAFDEGDPYRFAPADLVNLYKEKGASIFTKYSRPMSWSELGVDIVGTYFESWKYWLAKHKADEMGLISVKYDRQYLDAILKSRFNYSEYEQGMFGELIRPCLITSVNLSTGEPKVFKSKSEDGNIPTVDVIKATSAAPTYFTPVKINGQTYVDGGVYENNPALAALHEVMANAKQYLGLAGQDPKKFDRSYLKRDSASSGIFDPKDIILISIGTGYGKYKPIENDSPATNGGLFWADKTADMFMRTSSRGVHESIINFLGQHNKNYYRFDIDLGENVDLADTSKIPLMEQKVTSVLNSLEDPNGYAPFNSLQLLAEELVANHAL